MKLSKAAERTLNQMIDKALYITRERVSLNGDATVPRKVFEELLDAEAIVFTRRVNNFTKAYEAR